MADWRRLQNNDICKFVIFSRRVNIHCLRTDDNRDGTFVGEDQFGNRYYEVQNFSLRMPHQKFIRTILISCPGIDMSYTQVCIKISSKQQYQQTNGKDTSPQPNAFAKIIHICFREGMAGLRRFTNTAWMVCIQISHEFQIWLMVVGCLARFLPYLLAQSSFFVIVPPFPHRSYHGTERWWKRLGRPFQIKIFQYKLCKYATLQEAYLWIEWCGLNYARRLGSLGSNMDGIIKL